MSKFIELSRKLNIMVSKLPTKFTSINYSTSVENYVTVYTFPYIVPISILNRLKYYHTILTSVAVPSSVLLNQLNVFSNEIPQLTALVGIAGCINLYSLGYFSNYAIGFIYYNIENKSVKIAYVDFWGKRKETLATVGDLKLVQKLGAKISIFGTPLVKVSTDELFKINLYYGTVLDDRLNEILFK